jgi:hypothetical protein
MYMHARAVKDASLFVRSMFEPSMEMLNLFGGFERSPSSTTPRSGDVKQFWEDGQALDGTMRPAPSGVESVSFGNSQQDPEPVLNEEQIEEEVNRLMTRCMEVRKTIKLYESVCVSENGSCNGFAFTNIAHFQVEAVLREKFDDEACIETCRVKLQQCTQFYADLGTLSSELGVLKGAAFQELLGRGTGNPRGHINRERVTGLVKIEKVLTDEAEISRMIKLAEGLCDLVRVKIEDDNDLGLAMSGANRLLPHIFSQNK